MEQTATDINLISYLFGYYVGVYHVFESKLSNRDKEAYINMKKQIRKKMIEIDNMNKT